MFKKSVIFLIFIFLLPMQFSLATTTTSQYKDEAKDILQKITSQWQKINNWGVGLLWDGKLVTQLKENLKQGWVEEKLEYKQDFFKTLGSVWEKIKNSIFRKQGS